MWIDFGKIVTLFGKVWTYFGGIITLCGKVWHWCTEVDHCLVVYVCQRSVNIMWLSGVCCCV